MGDRERDRKRDRENKEADANISASTISGKKMIKGTKIYLN